MKEISICQVETGAFGVRNKHLRNLFPEGELEPRSVRAKFAHTAEDGKTYQVERRHLDVIRSLECLVKSLEGTCSLGVGRCWCTCCNSFRNGNGSSRLQNITD